MIPAAFCGLLATLFTLLISFADFEVGIEFFPILQNPFFIILIGVFSLDYICSLYKEQLEAKYQVGQMKKFHKGFALFLGLFSAFNVYYWPQLSLLFSAVASQTNFDLQSITVSIGQWEIPAIFILPVVTLSFTGLMKQMIFSMDDKPHLFLTTAKQSHLEKFLSNIVKYFKKNF